YKIFNNKLTFVKEKSKVLLNIAEVRDTTGKITHNVTKEVEIDKFKASYEVELVLFIKNKQFTASSYEEEYVVENYQETQSSSNFLINQVNLSVPAGEYKLSFKLIDHNSEQVLKSEQQISITSLKGNEPAFSGIELARSVKENQDSPKFTKRGKEIIPSVSGIFGDPEDFLWIYFELYNFKALRAEDYSLVYELEAGNKSIVFKDTTSISLLPVIDQTSFYDFIKISINEIKDGAYTLHLKLLNKEGKVRAKAQKELNIEWSLLYQVKNNYPQAVELLRYVASDKELKELKEAKEEDRTKKWIDFWKSKDPTPDTPENELMEEYYKRVKYANEHFGIYNKEGYKTDMGVVYIKFGPPDEVDRHPFELSSRPYVVWYYYRLHRKFLFIDVTGYGEYELQYPYNGKR
ncbi:MAG: GWxTD domain-containing protein, partial [candidate division Zixibacteria bacterium]|nr:GWxTD domain-containing protein [candidate division Zixibacteria bacterium]